MTLISKMASHPFGLGVGGHFSTHPAPREATCVLTPSMIVMGLTLQASQKPLALSWGLESNCP